MAYNLKDDIYGILEEKSKYESGEKNQDENEKLKAKSRAQRYYNNLVKNGYGTVANNLSARNFADSQKYINSYYAKTGRVNPREYFIQKGKAYNIKPQDINSLISYDGETGEVAFAGKNIGKPDGMADNKSWYKSDYLDGIWDSYIKDNGISRTEDQLSGVNSEEARDKINRSFETAESDRKYMVDQNDKFMDYNYNHNPYETDIGKSIMDRFDYLGGVASGDAVADGAAANSGNIDSFSAANAARQKLAFETAGSKAVLDDFNSRLSNAQKRLADMGVTLSGIRDSMHQDISLQQNEAQRNYENGQQRTLNRQNIENDTTANLKTKADVTGYVPAEWTMTDDPFFTNFLDEKGKLKPEYEKTDFQKLINVAKERGDTDLANKYAVLRGLKIFGNFDKYGQYAAQGDLSYPKPKKTADYDVTLKQIESAENIANGTNDLKEKELQNNKDIAEIDAQNKLDQITTAAKYSGSSYESNGAATSEPTLTASQAAAANENGEKSQVGNKTATMDLSSAMKKFITTVNDGAIAQGFNKVLNTDGSSTGYAADDYLANKLCLDTTLTDAEKEKFIDLWELSDEVLDTVINSHRYKTAIK